MEFKGSSRPFKEGGDQDGLEGKGANRFKTKMIFAAQFFVTIHVVNQVGG